MALTLVPSRGLVGRRVCDLALTGDAASLVCLRRRRVGPRDPATFFRSFPSYWVNIMTRRRQPGGDHDANLNRQTSLLIKQGKNDPRVTIANTNGTVAALRAAKREVT